MATLAQIDVPQEVLARARTGDEGARAAIYAAVSAAVFGLVRRLAGNRALADDLFQETMLTLYQRLGEFRSEAPLGAWVRQIAVTRCLMYLRSPWHRARLLARREEDAEDWYEAHLPTTAAPNAECLDVERALATLTPTARAVVWLFEVEGYSHEEIARSFGRSISFSKSQLARAHSRLRECLEPRGDRQTCTPM